MLENDAQPPRQPAAQPPEPDPLRPQREQMVEAQISARGIHDPRVLEAMRTVPRERFVPPAHRERAFEDCALPLFEGQTISQPYIVAYMTEHLDVRPEHRVLEIGTGSGYQAAILARLAREVVSIERIEALARSARQILDALGASNVVIRTGDGSLGDPSRAPFDRIMVTAAGPSIPDALIEQLAEDGIMIIPAGEDGGQTLRRVRKRGGSVTDDQLIACRFVPLVGRGGWGEREGD